MSEVLYHFTSLEGLDRIIKQKQMALYDITKSNDPSEGRFVLETLLDTNRRLAFNDELTEEQYYRMRGAFNEFYETEYSFGRMQSVVCSISFCELKGSRLPLWRTYGKNGKGVAIGVGKEKLKRLGAAESFEFKKVEYLSEAEITKRAEEFWLNNRDVSEKELIERIRTFYNEGYFIKREENSFENEWRLVSKIADLNDYFILPNEVPDYIETYFKEDDIVFYRTISIANNDVINNIEIGPNCQMSHLELEVYLKRNGIQVFSVGKDRGISMR